MKIKYYLWVGLVMVQPLLGAAESPTELFQKGLMEEEANHNLPAAIENAGNGIAGDTSHESYRHGA